MKIFNNGIRIYRRATIIITGRPTRDDYRVSCFGFLESGRLLYLFAGPLGLVVIRDRGGRIGFRSFGVSTRK